MRKTLLSLVTAAALMAATTSPMLAQGTGGSPGATTGGPGRKGERHPEIRAALRHLNAAKAALQKGSKDFGGHREKALDLTNQAIQEAQQALQSDKQ